MNKVIKRSQTNINVQYNKLDSIDLGDRQKTMYYGGPKELDHKPCLNAHYFVKSNSPNMTKNLIKNTSSTQVEVQKPQRRIKLPFISLQSVFKINAIVQKDHKFTNSKSTLNSQKSFTKNTKLQLQPRDSIRIHRPIDTILKIESSRPLTRSILNMDLGLQADPNFIMQSDIQIKSRQYLLEHTTPKVKQRLKHKNDDTKNRFVNLQLMSIAMKTKVGRKMNLQDKKHNQDEIIAYHDFSQDYRIFGVCDGHGPFGHFVAQMVANQLTQQIADQLTKNQFILQYDINFHNILLNKAFTDINVQLNKSNITTSQSGCTANIVLFAQQQKQVDLGSSNLFNSQKLKETVIYCAHVGDSRAIVVRSQNTQSLNFVPRIIQLSDDHIVDDPVEKQRIIDRGGVVQHFTDQNGMNVGPARVWLPDLSSPGLAMSRSFGDKVAHSLGVICEPQIKKYTLQQQDLFLVIGSDGIWQYMSNEKVAHIVHECYLTHGIEAVAQHLCQTASEEWIKNDSVIDDISCIIIYFSPQQ